jgi:hypothetical protein
MNNLLLTIERRRMVGLTETLGNWQKLQIASSIRYRFFAPASCFERQSLAPDLLISNSDN